MVSPWVKLSRAVIELALYDLAKAAHSHGAPRSRVQDDAAWFFASGEHEIWCQMAEYDADIMFDVAREVVVKYGQLDRGLDNDSTN